ncbi:MAG: archaemetzincin family Zn-dependent metalloprotease [Desulfobacteraceae bacterium]|jgi:archaemetzincin
MAYIYILPIDTGSSFWIEPLDKSIHRAFGYSIKRLNRKIALEKTFDLKRSQYNSSQILLQVISNPPSDAVKILGIVNVDLFIPVLTFVYGEAQLRGIGSLVSMHRLNNAFYGLPENRDILTERLIKETIHELGHNFGLVHCPNQRCVMRSSTYVEDIDHKSRDMCNTCRDQLVLMRRKGNSK